MANIRVDINGTIKDGSEIVFRSPVDCSAITGLVVYCTAENGAVASTEFVLADAHGHNVGDIDHLFSENVVVKVILDVTHGMAFVQNADTNKYIEETFVKSVNGVTPDKRGNVTITAGGLMVYTLTEGETIDDAPADADLIIDPYTDPEPSGGDLMVYTLAEGETVDDAPADADFIIDPYTDPETPAGTDISLNVAGASVGQTVRISAVDEAGKPTAWEAVEMPSGGTGEEGWFLITERTLEEDGAGVGRMILTKTDEGNAFECRQIMLVISGTVIAEKASGGYQVIRCYDNEQASGASAVFNGSRVPYGAGGSQYISTIEFGIFAGVTRVICCGGQNDTTNLIFRDKGSIDTIKSIELTAFMSNWEQAVGIAAGGRVAVYGRK